MSFHCPDKYRVRDGQFGTPNGSPYGAFFVPFEIGRAPLKVIATDGQGDTTLEPWEHVSVSLPNRCPTWDEMCKVKSLFWDDTDCIVQFHPPRSEYVNNHRFCLHLWRPVDVVVPTPPSILVGDASLGVIA